MKRFVIASGLAAAGLLAPFVIPVDAKPLRHFKTFHKVDLAVAGLGGMRNQGHGTLTFGGPPPAATVIRAYLYWHGPTKSTNPDANANVFMNGQLIKGTNIGFSNDNCWPPFGEPHFDNSQAYRADVTDIVAAYGNGDYSLTGFGDDPPSEPGAVNTNGMSLIVIYDDGDPLDTDRDIIIYDGNDGTHVEDDNPWFDGLGWDATIAGINSAIEK